MMHRNCYQALESSYDFVTTNFDSFLRHLDTDGRGETRGGWTMVFRSGSFDLSHSISNAPLILCTWSDAARRRWSEGYKALRVTKLATNWFLRMLGSDDLTLEIFQRLRLIESVLLLKPVKSIDRFQDPLPRWHFKQYYWTYLFEIGASFWKGIRVKHWVNAFPGFFCLKKD